MSVTPECAVINAVATVPAQLDPEGAGPQEIVLRHSGEKLEDHCDRLTLKRWQRELPVTVKIVDFSDEEGQWTVFASHMAGGQTQTWSRGSAWCEHTWATADDIDFTVTVKARNQSGAEKERPIFIKVKPKEVLPDH